MRRTIVIALCLAIIIYLIKINNYLYDHFMGSIKYREIENSSMMYESLRKTRYPQQYTNIILIVLDGATREYLYDERIAENIVKRWRKNGIRYTRASCMLPTVSAPNYFSLISGAPPFIHGVINNSRRFPRYQKIGTVFDHLNAHGISSAVIGFNWYKDMLGGKTAYYPVECCEKSDSPEVIQSAMRLIESGLPSFTLIHFLAPDNAAHQSGSDGRYRRAISEIDGLIEDMLGKLDERYPDSLVMVMSDHGMNSDGHHGGSDPDSLMIPLYVLGRNLENREIDRPVYNLAISPTVSALLGIPIAPFSSGSVLHDIIEENRRTDYLYRSIEKKQAIVNSVRGISGSQFAMGENLLQSLVNRDGELTGEILGFPDEHRSRILYVQRVAALALLIAFFMLLIYRAESGIPLLLAINMALLVMMGFSMRLLNSRYVFDIAVAVYLILLLAVVVMYRKFLLDISLSERINEFQYVFRLLELLFPLAIIVAGFFVPFYAHAPDVNIFAFRFYQLSFLQPFLFSLLIYLANRV